MTTQETARPSNRRRIALIVAGGLIVVAAVGTYLFVLPGQRCRAMLAGHASVRIKRFEVKGQGRRVLCANPEFLRILSERCCKSQPGYDIDGTVISYTASIEVGVLGECRVSIEVSRDRDAFVVMCPKSGLDGLLGWGDPDHYTVDFPADSPIIVREFFDLLRGETPGVFTLDARARRR